jgi:hypothetical protein
MEESFVFQCPACARDLTLPTQVAGRTGKCPKCEAVITIPSQETTDFDLGDFEVSSGESTIDLPRPDGLEEDTKEDTQSKITEELQNLLDELEGD